MRENKKLKEKQIRISIENLPIILENEARVLNGACGASSKPLNSWIRFSASRSKLFKWLPNESVDLTGLKRQKRQHTHTQREKRKNVEIDMKSNEMKRKRKGGKYAIGN